MRRVPPPTAAYLMRRVPPPTAAYLMRRVPTPPVAFSAAYLLLLLAGQAAAVISEQMNVEEPVEAAVNVSYVEPESGQLQPVLGRADGGRYGRDSPKEDVPGGMVLAPARDRQGCEPHTRFVVPPNTRRWIALLRRGNCTFKEKILRAAAHKATAVVIYNNSSEENLVTMAHKGTGNIVAIMISEQRGREILHYVEKNFTVLMSIAVGSSHSSKYSRGSLVFVSISFIVLMITSLAWLIFYFIQKFRYANLRGRNQRHLGDVANKAIKKLTTRTVKRGDKETDPEFDHCAVCIEGYKSNDVVRILPCKHVFHKQCVDPWLNEHCTCPICKLNILKALGILPELQCAENSAFDIDRTARGSLANQRFMPTDVTSDGSISLEPLRFLGSSQMGQEEEFVPRTREMNITITKEWLIIASFGVLSALTLFYMVIKATAASTADEVRDPEMGGSENETISVLHKVRNYEEFEGISTIVLNVTMKMKIWRMHSSEALYEGRPPSALDGWTETSDVSPQQTTYEIKLTEIQPSRDQPEQGKTSLTAWIPHWS